MINVNTIGHEIPEKIKSCISEWILKLSLKTIKIKEEECFRYSSSYHTYDTRVTTLY